MDFDKFRLLRTAFEIRFDQNFLLWDRAGVIGRDLTAAIPDLKLVSGNPPKQQYVLLDAAGAERKWILELEMARFVIVFHKPQRSLSDTWETTKIVTDIVTKHLQIQQFTRVGTRAMFAVDFASLALVRSAIAKSGLVKAPVKSVFGSTAPAGVDHVSVSYSANAVGVLVQLYTSDIDIQGLGSGDEDIPLDRLTKHRLMFDVDRFTESTLPTGAFNWKEWFAQLAHSVQRDAPQFLESI